MSTPNNVFETISSDDLVTATGGAIDPVQKQLWQLSHTIKDAVSAQQNNANSSNSQMTTMAMLALALRNR